MAYLFIMHLLLHKRWGSICVAWHVVDNQAYHLFKQLFSTLSLWSLFNTCKWPISLTSLCRFLICYEWVANMWSSTWNAYEKEGYHNTSIQRTFKIVRCIALYVTFAFMICIVLNVNIMSWGGCKHDDGEGVNVSDLE